MNKENFNENFFIRGVLIPLSIEEAYKLAATPEGMSKWFITGADFIAPDGNQRKRTELAQTGDKYEWNWGYKDFKVSGEVLEAEMNEFMKVSFGPSYTVTFSVEKFKDKTLFKIVQECVKGTEKDEMNYINCYGCWTFFLNNMKSVIEGGVDLRESETELDELVNR
jgi:uncharacterized protein YndB with AHSA1/START domain